MVAVKTNDADRFIADPPDGLRLFLVHGSDPGAVTERARALERTAQKRDPAGGNLIRLNSEELTSDPGRVSDEALSVSMFGGEPILSIRITDGRHNLMPALQPLMETPPDAAWIIVEAGELRRTNPLRKAFEAGAHAASIVCYELDTRDLGRMIGTMVAEAGLAIEDEALETLSAMLGADRMASRNEIEKLILYAGRDDPITLAHVTAAVGENLALRSDRIIDSTLLGRAGDMDDDLVRLQSEGQSASGLATQMLRHLMAMQLMRERIDKGSNARQAVEGARPPVFFKRKAQVTDALGRWPADHLRRARIVTGDAIAASRRMPLLEFELVSNAMHRIALMARRLGRSR